MLKVSPVESYNKTKLVKGNFCLKNKSFSFFLLIVRNEKWTKESYSNIRELFASVWSRKKKIKNKRWKQKIFSRKIRMARKLFFLPLLREKKVFYILQQSNQVREAILFDTGQFYSSSSSTLWYDTLYTYSTLNSRDSIRTFQFFKRQHHVQIFQSYKSQWSSYFLDFEKWHELDTYFGFWYTVEMCQIWLITNA